MTERGNSIRLLVSRTRSNALSVAAQSRDPESNSVNRGEMGPGSAAHR